MSEWFAHQVKKKGCRGQCATFHLLQRDHCLISTEDFDVMYLVVSSRHSYNVILIFVKSLYKVLRFSDKKNRKDHWIVRLLVAVEFNISGTATTWFSSNELLHNLKIKVLIRLIYLKIIFVMTTMFAAQSCTWQKSWSS